MRVLVAALIGLCLIGCESDIGNASSDAPLIAIVAPDANSDGNGDLTTPGLTGEERPVPLLVEGTAAPGLPDTNISGVDSFNVSDNGWLVAGADTGLLQGEDYAVFRGPAAGPLSPILVTGDAIEGFPDGVSFHRISQGAPLVTEDSTVWMIAELLGAGTSNTAVLQITPDGNVVGMLRMGHFVPGIDPVSKIIDFVELKIAGDEAYVVSRASDGGGAVLIHLTTNRPRIILSSNPDFYSPPLSEVDVSFASCRPSAGKLLTQNNFSTSETGAIAVHVFFTPEDIGTCPEEGILQYQSESFSTHLFSEPEAVPSGGTIVQITNLELRSFNDENVAIVEVTGEHSASLSGLEVTSLWTTTTSGTPKLLAVEDDTLPPDFLNTFGSPVSNSFSAGTDPEIALLLNEPNGATLYTGNSRPDQPYPSPSEIVPSQFERIIGENSDAVPGSTDLSYFRSISAHRLNDVGQIYFIGQAFEQQAPLGEFTGVWVVNPGDAPTIRLSQANTFDVEGSAVSLIEIFGHDAADSGDLVVGGYTLDGSVLVYQPAP